MNHFQTLHYVVLLGVYLSDDLKWDCHVEKIHEKAAKRLYQLRILKRAGVASDTLVKVYCANVRPVLEYACPVWHTNLTNIQSQLLETVQKRAFKIVYPESSYSTALKDCNIPTLHSRREQLCQFYFKDISDPTNKINDLLPLVRNNTHNTRLKNAYVLPKCHTNRFKNSFIPYALYNFQ